MAVAPLDLDALRPCLEGAIPGVMATCGADEKDVWYTFDPAPDTRYFINITGTSISSSVAIFSSCASFIDDACFSATNPQADYTADFFGSPFFIRIATDETQETDFTITIEVAPSPPANDECSNAAPVTVGVPIHGTTVNASGTDNQARRSSV